ncbi:MAG: threonine--tRNA ligase [Wenzhouxiangellaceae bacterium]|nr:threonine--tRNA ligase [Wenzhouxiangellaceae bacterium]
MIEITLPDGSRKTFDEPVTVADVAAAIGPGLAKATLAGEFDGRLVDADYRIDRDGTLRIITPRDDEGIEIIRHSTAHLMAQAVKRLYPETQVTIGPTVENGFYYDFAREEPFRPEDLEAIEKEMQRIVAEDLPVQRSELPRDEAIEFFRDQGEEYKAKIIEDIPADETLSLYRQGEFVDLCRGPHVPSTGKLGAFRLTKLAGAYWRGDSDNEMLQRVYGTAWPDKKALKQYLKRLEEAEKRDHRKLGKRLGLFHTQAEAPGMVFWHDHGWRIYRLIQDYIRERLEEAGYQEVHTPEVVDLSLWQKSGHWDNFKDDMFITSSEDRSYAIKPMNCPCHVQIFNQGLKSYRDLPLRMAEFGSCHRNEPSGALHGLMRVRNFVQDDAHIFCTPEQMREEVLSFNALVFDVYRDFGFEEIQVKLSTRPEKRVGSDEVWDRAEKALEEALDEAGIDYEVQPGEGAFYGPKIEFSLTDCIGRVWQCGTMQVDFSMPGRLGAEYVDENGQKQVPVMLHRAILGSVERFIGVLIEHYSGNLPVWLAPVQVQVLNITDAQADYARGVTSRLAKLGFRAECDLRNEKIGFKIREQTLAKVPYLLVVGEREKDEGTVAVRQRDGSDLGTMRLEAFADRLGQWEAQRGRTSAD